MIALKGLVFAAAPDRARLWSPDGVSARQLAPVVNRPILAHALDTLVEAGIRQVAIVVSPATASSVRAAVGDGAAWRVEVEYILQSNGAGLEDGLARSEAFADGDSIVAYIGEGLLRRKVAHLVDGFRRHAVDAMVVLHQPIKRRAPVGRERSRWSRLISGPAGEMEGAVPTGLYVLGPRVFWALRKAGEADGDLEEMQTLLDYLVDAGGRVAAQLTDGWWSYAEQPDSLLEANRLVLDELPSTATDNERDELCIQGRVTIDPTATVEATTVRGPVAIGPRARISNAFIGPYTAIGEDTVIDGVEIENSVVLPRACIRDVAARLESSIIGSDASVRRDFSLPRSLRLRIGHGAEVRLD